MHFQKDDPCMSHNIERAEKTYNMWELSPWKWESTSKLKNTMIGQLEF